MRGYGAKDTDTGTQATIDSQVLTIINIYQLLSMVSWHLVPGSTDWFTSLIGITGITVNSSWPCLWMRCTHRGSWGPGYRNTVSKLKHVVVDGNLWGVLGTFQSLAIAPGKLTTCMFIVSNVLFLGEWKASILRVGVHKVWYIAEVWYIARLHALSTIIECSIVSWCFPMSGVCQKLPWDLTDLSNAVLGNLWWRWE